MAAEASVRRRTWTLAAVGALGATTAILAGAVLLARAVDDDGADEVIRLDEPGEYVEPGSDPNPDLARSVFPDVELRSVDDDVVRLMPGDGRPMVVNLWYSSCPPCARELAAFADVHDEVGERVRFVGVDPVDPVAEMQRFATDRGVTYELLRDPEQLLAGELGIVAYPMTLFVDADGTIVDQSGPLDDDELRERIEALW